MSTEYFTTIQYHVLNRIIIIIIRDVLGSPGGTLKIYFYFIIIGNMLLSFTLPTELC